jgi:hypothetical protein
MPKVGVRAPIATSEIFFGALAVLAGSGYKIYANQSADEPTG